MKKLYQVLGHKEPLKGLLGIEIEAEGRGMNAVQTKYWRSENDGSLRGDYPYSRAEFVLNAPIDPKEVVPALQELVKALPEAEFDFSYRTSVHVHVNVQELTHAQIMSFVYTYLLLEEPLMTYCGKGRKANRFCLRLGDAEGLMDTLKKVAATASYHDCDDNIRYSSINLAALMKYGSLEFRGMRGNIEIPVIHTWTRALMALREYAIKQESPNSVKTHIEKVGSKEFMLGVLGAELNKVFTYPRVLKDMAKSYSISLDLPYAYQVEKGEKPKPLAPEKAKEGGERFGNVIFISSARDSNGVFERDDILVYKNDYYIYDGGWHGKGRYEGKTLEQYRAEAAPQPFNIPEMVAAIRAEIAAQPVPKRRIPKPAIPPEEDL